MKLRNLCLVSLAAVALAGCGGGGGSSSGSTGSTTTSGSDNTGVTTALTVANKVSVVDANTTNGGLQKVGLKKVLFLSFPETSDYMKDTTNVYVQEGSTEAFSTVNEILCMMGQTRYEAMLNKGDYKALVDKNLCSGGSDQNANSGQNAGAGAPNYQEFIINSSRLDNNSPQIVKLWIHEKARNDDPAKAIIGKAVITEGSSTTNPLGQFTMDFIAYPVNANGTANTAAQPQFKGFLKTVKDAATGQISLQFGSQDMNQGTNNSSQLAVLQRSADGAAGSGSVKKIFTDGTVESQNIAYNASFFHRKNAIDDVCLDRGKFETSAWRYGLYDSAGTRVDRNSGFPIKLADGTSGWIGYWGLSLQGNATLANGATVTKQGFNGAADVSYTALVAGGKLKKHTQQKTTLGSIKNIPLDGWMETTSTNPPQSVNYRVIWDGTGFYKIAKFDQTANTFADMTKTKITSFTNQSINLWSQSVGGQVIVNLTCSFTAPTTVGQPPAMSCTAPTDAMPVVYYSEDMVYPNDPANPIPASLACANNCLDPASISTSSPFFADSGFINAVPSSALFKQYSFDSSNYVLKSGTSPLVTTTTTQQWGVQTGPLFDPTVANVSLLACDNNPGQTCSWNAWSKLPVFYTWETGGNPFNQFSALKDAAGKFLTFDPPLPIKYTYVSTGNAIADAKYGGTTPATFALDYSGFGQLNGIPGKCVDMRSGNTADCSTGSTNQNIRWVPEFVIPPASPVSSGTSTYYVKPLDVEQRMKQAAAGSCTALTTTTLALPAMSAFNDPTTIGAEPAITAAPAVVGGVVK